MTTPRNRRGPILPNDTDHRPRARPDQGLRDLTPRACGGGARLHDPDPGGLWAYPQEFGRAEIVSEDFEHDRLYGAVRVVNPFL